MIAHVCKLKVGDFIHTFGDAHIYSNSIDQVKEQLDRKPKKLPRLILPKLKCIDDLKEYTVNDFKLENYDHHPAIKAKMAI